ncbi:MAG: RusA family crossover junction endodeoxyribonuclease [Clostridia bacterium]|nr:RusA family crossover junction endodeoxyribonuclease [Clostridia bacterium]
MTYEFEVEGKIVGKERPRVNMYSGMIYTPNKTKDYEFLIQQSFKIQNPHFTMLEGRISIEIIAYMSIPKNTSKVKTKAMLENQLSPTKKPDIDNIAKSILDSMNKFVFKDDNQVSKISVEKRFGEVEKVYVRISEY